MNCTIQNIINWLFSDGLFQKFFAEELRSNFFNGFLSLSGFMLAAKTFIVLHMKKEVYDRDEYLAIYEEKKRIVGQKSATRYGPLERMSKSLYWIIVLSMIAAFSQVTIGLIPCNTATLICLALVLVAFWKLWNGLRIMKSNLDSWFKIINEQEEKRELEIKQNGKE